MTNIFHFISNFPTWVKVLRNLSIQLESKAKTATYIHFKKVSFFLFLSKKKCCSVVKEERLHSECRKNKQIKTALWCQTELCQKNPRPCAELAGLLV